MGLIIIWLIIGGAIGAAVSSFMDGRGGTISLAWSVVAGIIGATLGGFVALKYGALIVGEGPEFIVSFVAAAVMAFIGVLLARALKK